MRLAALLLLREALSLRKRHSATTTTPIPLDIPDELPSTDEMAACRPSDPTYNMQDCADAVLDYERRFRLNLAEDRSSVFAADATASVYQQMMDNITEAMNHANYELGISATSDEKSIQTVVDDAQSALYVLQANTGLVPDLQNISDQVLSTLTGLPEMIGNYTADLIVNVTNDLTSLLNNQTKVTSAELDAVSKQFTEAQRSITTFHTDSLNSATEALNAMKSLITDWSTYQTGNLSVASASIGQVSKNLDARVSQLELNLSDFASNLSSLAAQNLSDNAAVQGTVLLEALNSVTSNLNDTYNKDIIKLQAADKEIYKTRADFKLRNTQQLESFQKQLQRMFMNVANFSAVERVAVDEFVTAALRARQSNFSALNLSLSDAASAAFSFEGVANQSEITGLLYTRKILAALNDMLNSVKKAVTAQTSSFAAATGGALQQQASGVADSSSAGQSAANSAKAAIGGKAADATGTAGKNMNSMVGAMADLLDAISGMSDVMKAKVGLFSDSSATSLTSVDNTVGDAVESVAATLADISEVNREKSANSAAALLGLQADTQDQAALAFSAFQGKLSANLDDMGAMYAKASSAGKLMLSDAKDTASASSVAVGGVQETSGRLTSASKDAASEISSSFGQLGNVVTNTETAAQQAVSQAQQNMMDFVSQQGFEAAQQMTRFAGDTNQTFKAGFQTIQKSVTATQTQEKRQFDDLMTAGTQLRDGLQAAITNFDQLINSTINQNSSIAKLMDTMGSNAKARWDAIVASKLNEFEAILSALNDAGDKYLDNQIGSMQNQSQAKLDLVTRRMHRIISDMFGMSGGANVTILNLQAVLSGLNSTATFVDESAANATSELAVLNAKQDANFALLTNKSADVDAFLVASASAMNQQVVGQNATVVGMMNNITNNASSQVQTDASSFVNFTNSFISSISTLDEAQNAFEEDQSDRRMALIAEVQTDIASVRDDLINTVLMGNSENDGIAAQLNTVLQEIAGSQQLLGSEQGAALANIQKKLKTVSSMVSGIGDSLQTNLDAAMTRISSEAHIQKVKSGDAQTGTVSNQTTQASGLGNQVLSMLDGVIAAGNSGDTDLNDQQVAAMQMAQMIQGLGVNGSQALRNLLSAIQSGKITVQQALASASTMNEANLDSVGGIAASLQAVVQGYVSGTQLFFGNASTQVDTYNVSAEEYIENMGVLQDAAAANLVTESAIVNLLTDSYTSNMTSLMASANEALQVDRSTESADSVFVK